MGGPTCVKDLTKPIIGYEEYSDKLDILVEYAENDAVTLTSYRPIDKKLYRKLFIYAYEGKDIDF